MAPKVEPILKVKPLFSVLDTAVTAEPSAAISPTVVFILGTLTSGETSWPKRLRSGAFLMLAYESASVIHGIGHIVSSRKANAPMDAIHLAAPLPRTVYYNNDIPPESHIMRAVGGPIMSGLGFLVSFIGRFLTSANSASRELMNLFSFMNFALGLGSLLPMPFIDGGSIFKWRLVQQGGRTPDAAAALVEEANLILGGLCGLIGFIFLPFRFWKTAVAFIFLGAGFILAGLGKIGK